MSYWPAIVAIVSIFMCGWAIMVALNPRRWRLWWMTFLRVVDMESTREQRRSQEHRLAILAYIAFSVFLVTAGLCGFLAWSQWTSSRGPRSETDQMKDRMIQDVEKMKSRKQFRKLD